MAVEKLASNFESSSVGNHKYFKLVLVVMNVLMDARVVKIPYVNAKSRKQIRIGSNVWKKILLNWAPAFIIAKETLAVQLTAIMISGPDNWNVPVRFNCFYQVFHLAN